MGEWVGGEEGGCDLPAFFPSIGQTSTSCLLGAENG